MADLPRPIVLITGSTDGIGKHTAELFAARGATVLVHGRNEERVNATIDELKKYKGSRFYSYVFDISSMAEVRKLSDAIHEDVSAIDILINNAGVLEKKKRETVEGFEMTFAVNVMAPFLLTSLLLDLVAKGVGSHVINVSSISQSSHLDLANLQFKDEERNCYNGLKAYEQSKTLVTMITFTMHELFQGSGVRVNCLDPGTVNTKMLLPTWGAIGIDVKKANNEYNLATSDDSDSGCYFVNGRKSKPMSICYDKDYREKVWDMLVKLTGAVYRK